MVVAHSFSRDFSTKEMDKIDLVDKEEFLLTAPSNLTCDPEAADPHKFLMNRVTHFCVCVCGLTRAPPVSS